MPFEFASSVTCSQLINLHQRFFFFFEGGESFNVGFLFFYNFKQKKRTVILGILIICQHCYTFKSFLKKCFQYFLFLKFCLLFRYYLEVIFFHNFILIFKLSYIYLKKRGKNKNHVLLIFNQLIT